MFLEIAGKYAAMDVAPSDRASEAWPAASCPRLFCAGCSFRRRCIHHCPAAPARQSVDRHHRRKASRFRSVESPRCCRAFASYRRAASRRSRHSPRARLSACHLTSTGQMNGGSIAASPCSSPAAIPVSLLLRRYHATRVVNQRCCSTARTMQKSRRKLRMICTKKSQ